MKKIALLVYDYTLFGGAEHVAANLANELSRVYEVSLISCFAEKEVPSFPLEGQVRTFVLNKQTLSIPTHCHALAKKLRGYLKTNGVGVLLNITAGINSVSYLATRHSATRVIYCEHSNLFNQTYGRKHAFRQWLGAKTADRVICLTAADAEEFRRKYGIGDRAGFIYNWYDGPTSTDYDEESKKIISVGRLEYVKGYDRLIAAAEQVFAAHPDWSWDIYGEGKFRPEIERMIAQRHLENHVILKGNCPTVIREYASHAMVVMTSYYEGLPLALVEAMANGLPAVSFDCRTGPGEIITDGRNGLLVENGNIDALAAAINRLIENPQLRREFSRHSGEVLPKFDKASIARQWIETIDSLMD